MTNRQIVRAAAFGVAFWFVAAMTVHLLPFVFDGSRLNAAMLVATIPIAWLSVPVSLWAAGADRRDAVEVNVIGFVAAALLDGIAITYLSGALYAGVSSASQFGAAWILWGAAWILIFAWRARSRA